MDQFEKAFIQVIDYLMQHKKDLKITSLQQLMEELGFDQGSRYYDIRTGKRVIDGDKRKHITNVLAKQYAVRKEFFKTSYGPILDSPINMVEEKAIKYETCKDQLAEAKKQIKELDYKLTECKKYHALLEQQILDYRAVIEKL